MKRLLVLLLWMAGVGIATASLSRWWYRHPDHFPRLPEGLWQAFDRLFGVTAVDGALNVELLVVVLLSFLLAVLAGAVVLLIFRLAMRRRMARLP